MGFRARGRPKLCENTAKTTTAPPAAPQGPPAPGVVSSAVCLAPVGRPCARNHMACHCTLPCEIHCPRI
eukprot:5671188-Heterocapsa_arctica.AAC.1